MSDVTYYIICTVLILGVLKGIALMSKVKTSIIGNGLSALCIFTAILVTLFKYNTISDIAIWFCMGIGLVIGLIGAYRVKMIEMPQVIALLNGVGGLASTIISFIMIIDATKINIFSMVTASIAIAVGMITFAGSAIAGAKLHKIITQRPIIINGHQKLITVNLLLIFVSIVAMFFVPKSVLPILALTCAAISGAFGFIFAIRVGGADMPITISLLNSLSGVAGSLAGMAIGDPLLVAVGGVVGASGLLLTQIMCRAMNRNLMDILLGKTSVINSIKVSGTENMETETTEYKQEHVSIDSINFSEVKKTIIVPGYGMALAQAQSLVKILEEKLEKNGVDVRYAIHPVAGRMPGHMNILLAESGVDYEKLYEIDAINDEFLSCDITIVIGANDVINPAANTAEGTPIYGMPILSVNKAKQIIICNFDLKPGYAGVPNPLYSDSKVILMLGDAKESLERLINLI